MWGAELGVSGEVWGLTTHDNDGAANLAVRGASERTTKHGTNYPSLISRLRTKSGLGKVRLQRSCQVLRWLRAT